MSVPWYIYILSFLVALPVYVLLAISLYGLVRAILAWVFAPSQK